MSTLVLRPKRAGKFGVLSLLFSVLLLISNLSYGEVTRELLAGEQLVTLAVENMT